jgi:CheY-like chemotaxis protein
MRCFEMSSLSAETGYCGVFCATSCESCAYFQSQVRRPANVLIITNDGGFRETLEQDNDGNRFRLRFTNCEYECSALMETFRPDYVVVDCSLPREQCEEFCHHITQDPRIPRARIILAASPTAVPALAVTRPYPCIEKSHAASQLAAHIQNESLPEPLKGGWFHA